VLTIIHSSVSPSLTVWSTGLFHDAPVDHEHFRSAVVE